MTTIVRAGLVAFTLMTTMTGAHARDGFEKVRCGGDVVRALIGQRGGDDEPVVAIEARRKALGLKDLGASDYGAFSSIAWLICGQAFMVLADKHTGLVRDAIQVPPHGKDRPWFEGFCKRKGKVLEASFVGILRDQGVADELPADAAWQVDEKIVKFVAASTDDLLCERRGILQLP